MFLPTNFRIGVPKSTMGTDGLFTHINEGLASGLPDGKPFLPHDIFEKLWAGDEAKQEIQKQTGFFKKLIKDQNSTLVDFVKKSARKVFAILVRSNLVKKVSNLPKHKFMDNHLPIVVEGTRVTSYNLLADDAALEWFQSWTKHEIAVKELEEDLVTDKAYEVEIDALELARQLQHPHLVSFIAGFERAGKRYMMFQWVDGGNLREFWQNHSWSRNIDIIRWALEQMKGLAEGLEALHHFNPKKNKNCRHGDLKPENIVRSRKSGSFGLLQIADMGLAKIHSLPTVLRPIATTTLAGTIRYQPPEIQTSTSGKRSRSYDIWSMGCILFELIIWLLFGPKGLTEFESSFDNPTQPFFHIYESSSLRPNVNAWKEHLEKICLSDLEMCVSPALKELFNYVCKALLVEDPESDDPGLQMMNSNVDGRQGSISPSIPRVLVQRATIRMRTTSRANITDLKKELHRICSNSSLDYFYRKETEKFNVTWDVLDHEDIASQLQVHPGRTSPRSGARPQLQIADIQNDKKSHWDLYKTNHAFISVVQYALLSDTWEICNDNIFARDFFRNITSKTLDQDFQALEKQNTRLCNHCSNPTSGIFSRCNNAPSYIQRGFPILPKAGSRTQARLFKHWAEDCDKNHSRSCFQVDVPQRAPTRLLDVGDTSLSTIKLDCYPKDRKSSCYVALSHPWGPDESKWFRTTSENIKEFKKFIDFKQLPQNFQDAVTVTRSLGVRYLWIDSLCIIQQGKDGDFGTEKEFMEDYYGGAYCTISASSARGTSSGFLKSRLNVRKSYAFNSGAGPSPEPHKSAFYICDAINDFARDVEESYLSTRGWVFQERALSRRTLHFTEKQVYWECGKGIRCETMTKLFNRKSSFLSDPHFPESAAKYYKGMRIEFFQYIYSKYSGLDFSANHEDDRSVALRGLENRMAKVYNVPAWHGILDGEYLHRSLLWQRDMVKTKSLHEISYEDDKRVPSWSWMAVMGPIRYMDAPFDWMEWNRDIKTPLGSRSAAQTATDFEVPAYNAKPDDNSRSTYDGGEEVDTFEKLKCVIIGWEKTEKATDSKDFYVLLVTPTDPSGSGVDHKRVGVARMTVDEIGSTEFVVKIV
ncbi:uncharacterized protein K444DRAFT_630355 [Hyaloscypha bicolor E]|uniref:Protein kinase domain-containing protein n=1 Tax=Hyaloscypha bicolor E TaxID=1095630 RepID=A0A2J6T6I7_9HELO|nr:uncharacterized protein K444DRAFT_630355 [Hyaloscypha bicolor E]PMD58641.1 hypothetical protein K444DRAFT_630355 [Hyaloscypha bicolor E]